MCIDRGGERTEYVFGKKGKPQRGHKAAAPLHAPRAFFLSAWLWRVGVLLTCVCMLRYWIRKVEPMEENGLTGLLRVKKS